jgi:hypothetical protein
MQRYEQLRDWSLHLSDNDSDLAEDLLHDAFIHWTFTRPNLSAIRNLEGYLHVECIWPLAVLATNDVARILIKNSTSLASNI